jgi:hypothetical protein
MRAERSAALGSWGIVHSALKGRNNGLQSQVLLRPFRAFEEENMQTQGGAAGCGRGGGLG